MESAPNNDQGKISGFASWDNYLRSRQLVSIGCRSLVNLQCRFTDQISFRQTEQRTDGVLQITDAPFRAVRILIEHGPKEGLEP
jgi:hypothetical protein